MKQEYTSRKFLLTCVAIAVSAILVWFGKLNTEWTACIVGIVSAYCGFNVWQKKGGEKDVNQG